MKKFLSFRNPIMILIILVFLLLGSSTFIAQNDEMQQSNTTTTITSNDTSAFYTILKVLKSPRCMNCHPSDDFPRQGDDGHIHLYNVQRGIDNQGGPVQTCNTCHQKENNQYANVPGAPHWGLAPRSMGWHGLSDAALGRSILDKTKNGNKSPEEIVHHMAHDPLVLWAWNPGDGRSLPPVPLDEFRKALDDWLAAGTPVPE